MAVARKLHVDRGGPHQSWEIIGFMHKHERDVALPVSGKCSDRIRRTPPNRIQPGQEESSGARSHVQAAVNQHLDRLDGELGTDQIGFVQAIVIPQDCKHAVFRIKPTWDRREFANRFDDDL